MIKERAARLRAVGDAEYNVHLGAMAGRRERVLVEKPGIGRTEGFTLVKHDGGVAGTIVEVDICGHDGSMLTGTIVTQQAA